jgi:hypothetical protein
VPCPALRLFAHVNSIDLDEVFGPLQFIDVAALAETVEDQWHNQMLVRVNDCVVRLGVRSYPDMDVSGVQKRAA